MLKANRAALVVLGVCFVLSVIGRRGESFSVFVLPLTATFGWDRADVVSIYSLSALTGGLSSPLVGRLFDRYGPLSVFALGLALAGGTSWAASFSQSLWQLQLSIGVAAGFGGACLGNVTHSLLLGRWFGPRLPTAMAIVFGATGASTLLWLPVSQVLIDLYGWRGAYQVLGSITLLLLLPLVLLPWRRFAAGSADVQPVRSAGLAESWTLGSAMRHPAFWGLFSTYFFTAVGMFAISVQVVAYLVEAGFTALFAATAWGFSGVLLVVGMVSVSLLDEWLGRRGAILLAYGLSVSGIVMLWLLSRYPSIWLLIGFVCCFGSTLGSRGPLISATAMSIFQGKRVGTIFGAISLGSGLGAAIGSWSGGLIHDWTNSYDPMIAFALVNVLLGMAPFLILRELRR